MSKIKWILALLITILSFSNFASEHITCHRISADRLALHSSLTTLSPLFKKLFYQRTYIDRKHNIKMDIVQLKPVGRANILFFQVDLSKKKRKPYLHYVDIIFQSKGKLFLLEHPRGSKKLTVNLIDSLNDNAIVIDTQLPTETVRSYYWYTEKGYYGLQCYYNKHHKVIAHYHYQGLQRINHSTTMH